MPSPECFSAEDRELLDRVREWPAQSVLAELSASVLRDISNTEGIEFATALLYHRVCETRRHADFIARLDAAVANPRRSASSTIHCAIVPAGGFAEDVSRATSGGLIPEVAAARGWRVEFVPIKSLGTLRENAQIIRDWFAHQAQGPLILISLSMGSSEVKLALSDPATADRFAKLVKGWINVCGLLNGTALVDMLLLTGEHDDIIREAFKPFKKYGGNFVDAAITLMRDMGHGDGQPLAIPLAVPQSVPIFNVIPFPLTRHLAYSHTRLQHGLLAPLGPNDGFGLLAEACLTPGLHYPVWGADHYMAPIRTDEKLSAGLLDVVEEMSI